MIERLTADAAVERIREYLARNHRVLGVDGFRTVVGGFVAPTDLILDLSTGALSVVQAAKAAEAFVLAHSDVDVTFEVVA